MRQTLKTRITTTVALLPIAIVVAIVLWWRECEVGLSSLTSFALMLIITFALRQTNNGLQLIRVRSWAVSSFFVWIVALASPIHLWSIEAMAGCALSAVYLLSLLLSYQTRKPQVWALLSALSISGLSLIYSPLICLALSCVLAMLLALRTLTLKSTLALLFGLLLPYEIWAAWHIYSGTLSEACSSIANQWSEVGVTLRGWENTLKLLLERETCIKMLIILYGFIAIIYYLRTSFNDKIRTRMHHLSIILQWPIVVALTILCSQQQPLLCLQLGLLSAATIAHYFVFSKGWLANVMFVLFILICCYLESTTFL